MTKLVDAQYYASLKTTLVPANGAGTPTFTRATTKNIFDNEGKLISVKSGAVTLAGARVVQNKAVNVNLSTWALENTTTSSGITDAEGGTTAYRITENASNTSHDIYIPNEALTGYLHYDTVSFMAKAGTASYVWHLSITVAGSPRGGCAVWDLVNGTATSSNGSVSDYGIVDEGGGWYRCWVTTPALGTGIHYAVIGICDRATPSYTNNSPNPYLGTSKYLDVYDYQLEQFASLPVVAGPGERVSLNKLSAPYHGGGADGVKYFDTDSSGVAIPDSTILGAHIDPESKTNNLLHCRNLTNAAWVKTKATAAKTQTGIDGLANSCSLLTATADNGTILQTITAAATAACSGFWVNRSVGTGSIFFTRNGGTDWLDITSLINSSTFTCVKIENTSVTNPQVGFKIATSGDAIIVDAGLNHAGTTLTLPIFTASAAVTRAADVLTYQTASNFSDTAGTILATYKPTYDTYESGSIVGSSTRGLYAGTSNSGVQALDGTNTINGPAGTPSGQIRIGARWSGSSLQCFALDSFGSSGSYDGSFNLSTIGILPGTAGYIRDLAIWTSSLTDVEIRDAWNLITTYITSGSLVGMQSILSSSASSISTVIYGTITATYVQPTLIATYTVPTIEAEI